MTNVNFSYNRGKVVSLPEDVSEITGGTYVAKPLDGNVLKRMLGIKNK